VKRWTFVLRKLALLPVSLLVASLVTYAALDLAPGDPLTTLAGGRTPPPGMADTITERYHLDDPFLVRYGHWLADALQGRFGESVVYQESVSTLLAHRVATTLGLVALAALVVVLVGVGLGVASGLRPGAGDGLILVGTAVLAASPVFVIATVLISLFAVRWGWFPVLGSGSGFGDTLTHLTLPALSIALGTLASVARVTRASIRTEAAREHVRFAVSQGIPAGVRVRRHVLRNAAPAVTSVVGVAIASLLTMSAVAEVAFSLNGLGSLLVASALAHDVAVVQAITLLFVVAFAVIHLVADVACTVLDPRPVVEQASR
jgi:peptide/nickel transport system permease protein